MQGSLEITWKEVSQSKGPQPAPRHGHRAVEVNNCIVIFGGGNYGLLDGIHVYNPAKNEWSIPPVKGQIPPSRAAYGFAAYGSLILVFGGMVEYSDYSNALYELETKTWIWRHLKPRCDELVPRPRLGHSFTMIEDSVYLFGGILREHVHPNDRYLNDFHILQIGQNSVSWKVAVTYGQSPPARESHSAVAYHHKEFGYHQLIVYGGMNGGRLGDLWSFDTETSYWSELKAGGIPPKPRSLHSAVVIGQRMFVFGGWVPRVSTVHDANIYDKKFICTNSLACLNLKTLSWEDDRAFPHWPSSPRARAGHCAVVALNRMYIWSGREGHSRPGQKQVCHSDLWFLEVGKPSPPEIVLGPKVTPTSIEISWTPSPTAEAYSVQIIESDKLNLTGGYIHVASKVDTKETWKLRAVVHFQSESQCSQKMNANVNESPESKILLQVNKADDLSGLTHVKVKSEPHRAEDNHCSSLPVAAAVGSCGKKLWRNSSSAPCCTTPCKAPNISIRRICTFQNSNPNTSDLNVSHPGQPVTEASCLTDISAEQPSNHSLNGKSNSPQKVIQCVGSKAFSTVDQNKGISEDVLIDDKGKVLVLLGDGLNHESQWFDVGTESGTTCVIRGYMKKNLHQLGSTGETNDREVKKSSVSDSSDAQGMPKSTFVHLQPSKSYAVRVAGINSCGQGAWSKMMLLMTSSAAIHSHPKTVKVVLIENVGAHLSWDAAPDATEYSVKMLKEILACVIISSESHKATVKQRIYADVYTGKDNKCLVPMSMISSAYVDKSGTAPAIIFSLTTKKASGTSQVTFVRWIRSKVTGPKSDMHQS